MVTVLEECLDDAISVLRNHAELPPGDAVAAQGTDCAPSLGAPLSATGVRRHAEPSTRIPRQRKITPNSSSVDSAAG